MCMGGGGSPKVEVPKPPPLPPPLPPPPAPKVQEMPKQLIPPGTKPDIRIGQSKKQSTDQQRRSSTGKGAKSLTIGNNQGMTL